MSANNEAMIHWPRPYKASKNGARFDEKIKAMAMSMDGLDAWNGNYAVSTLFYIYLLKKYKSHCLLYKGHGLMGFHFKFETESYLEMLSDVVIPQLVQCIRRGVQTIIIPLLLVFAEENSHAHANVLIYRKELNTIEHFEPHGKWIDTKALAPRIHGAIADQIQKLNVLLKEQHLPPVDLISAEDACPRMRGFQALESMHGTARRKPHENRFGYCVAWSLFFTELSLCNPGIPSREIHQRIHMLFDDKDDFTMGNYFLDMMRGYTRIINEKIARIFTLLFDKKYTVKDIYEMENIWETFKEEISLYAEVEMELLNKSHISTEEYIRELSNQMEKEGWRSVDDPNNSKWHNIYTNETTIPVNAQKIDLAMRQENAMRSSMTPTSMSPSPTNKKRKRSAKKRSITMTTRGMEVTNKRTTRSESRKQK